MRLSCVRVAGPGRDDGKDAKDAIDIRHGTDDEVDHLLPPGVLLPSYIL